MGLFGRRTGDSGDGRGDGAGPGADERTGSPWEGRGFVASVIVLGAVVVCLVIWLVAGRGGDDAAGGTPTPVPSRLEPTGEPTGGPAEPTAQPTVVPPATPGPEATPTPTPTGPVPNNTAGGCRTKAPDQRIPRMVAPAAVTWQFETNMLIPLQREAGPAATAANGLRSCFAHSPTGAVFAAMVTLGQVRNPDLTLSVLRSRIAPGPGRDLALRTARTSPTPRNAESVVQFAGFKVVDYLPERAIVYLAVQLDATTLGSLPVTVVWRDGDWRVVLQSDGSFNGSTAPDALQGLDGYVRFGGS